MTVNKLTFEAIMDMSPEELAQVNPSDLEAAEAEELAQSNQDPQQQSEQDDNDFDSDEGDQGDKEDEQGESDEDNGDHQDQDDQGNEGADDDSQEDDQANDEGNAESDNNDQDPETDESKKKTEEQTEKKDDVISAEDAAKYKSFFDVVTSEFKANGRTFTINDPADIISLMQKGLNYNQKMAAIKPYFGLIEVLKEHGLTDASSISYLVDLKNKKPEAIAKLVQESKIDTYDLNEEKANAYVPTQLDLSPQRAEMAAIDQEYEGDEDFAVVLGEITRWDIGARELLQKNPSMIRMLIEHKKSGIFDQIIPVLQQQQALGKIQSNALQAYDDIGRAMFAAAQQNQGEAQAQQQANQQQQQHAPNKPKAMKQQKESLEAAKKAASMSRTPRSQAQEAKPKLTEEDILSMSAEEFAKVNPKYL
ncbi:tail length tape measure protein [Acinetobacter phage Presley]|uniref:Tape measure protein n=1 Tax=Acinetobacter phage Presley TaxID=1406780 RepID=U5PZZ8_9CAUD|nr:tail length tape measure protein [Acinetobacter phage Presley]AGY48153.1 hypothetical protein Presley_86 [Acinetobacter phage Presley]